MIRQAVTVANPPKGTHTYNGLEQLAIRVTTNQTPAGTTHVIHDVFGIMPKACFQRDVIMEEVRGGAMGSVCWHAFGMTRERLWR